MGNLVITPELYGVIIRLITGSGAKLVPFDVAGTGISFWMSEASTLCNME